MKFKQMKWAPYLLILPSFLYLVVFFGWPMIRSLELAFQRDSQILRLREEPDKGSSIVGKLEKGTITEIDNIVDVGSTTAAGGAFAKSDQWYLVTAEDLEGLSVQGWAQKGDMNVRDVKVSSKGTVAGPTVQVRAAPDETSEIVAELGQDTEVKITGWEQLEETNKDEEWIQVRYGPIGQHKDGWVRAKAVILEDAVSGEAYIESVDNTPVPMFQNPDANSPIVAELEPDTAVIRLFGERKSTPQWFQITATMTNEQGEEIDVGGWVPQDALQISDRILSQTGRVEKGDGAKEWTLDYVKRMFRHSKFDDALWTTLLLLVLILPLQFTLAIIMALVLQSRLRGNTFFLYIYSIPLGISDLAAGLVWYSIFTQNGFLNTFLEKLGLIDEPFIFISPQHRDWIIVAIVLAEVWRATSIVMVIVVSGLQAIPTEFLEAGELFGANLWQRLRYIILPLLKPSLQVALILRTILAFQVFAVVIAIAGNVPEVITVLSNETYRWYSVGQYNNPNMAAAYAGFIMLISLGIAIFYLQAVRTQQEKEAGK